MQTGNDKISTWTTAERKKRYLSLIYFNAKNCLLGTNAVFFTPPEILWQHLQYYLWYQISTTTAAAVIQELYISSIFIYVLHLSQMMIA